MNKFAVLGHPIKHSLSPRLHNLALKAFNLEGFYSRFDLLDEKELLRTINKLDLNACNITIPYKKTAFLYSNYQDELCKKIGSANTLVKRAGKFYAYNTDILGFLKAIEAYNFKKALIIGAGGTAQALAYALAMQGKTFSILNRSKREGNFFTNHFFTYENFQAQAYDFLINTTPNGLINQALPAPEKLLLPLFEEAKFAFDVIYGTESPFLKRAKEKSLINQDGSFMLLYQAAYAFNLFYDNAFELETIVQAMKVAFSLEKF